jgi:hypothetical protein
MVLIYLIGSFLSLFNPPALVFTLVVLLRLSNQLEFLQGRSLVRVSPLPAFRYHVIEEYPHMIGLMAVNTADLTSDSIPAVRDSD